MLTHQRINHK